MEERPVALNDILDNEISYRDTEDEGDQHRVALLEAGLNEHHEKSGDYPYRTHVS